MSIAVVDLLIIGAGPVGLICAYLGQLCGISIAIVDKSEEPLKVGRADALNARTLQLLELVDLFNELYPLGKTCNTSSVWANGNFISRQSTWWEELEGCLHKHFLMIGQSYIEKLVDERLRETVSAVKRATSIEDIQLNELGCLSTLSNGERIQSRYIIGADGSRSFVRQHFQIPFEIVRPEIVWAVIDGIIETDFIKVPEIIVFQAETSDVAWIPREGEIDRFYVRIDTNNVTLKDAIAQINRAVHPHYVSFKEIVWFSKFSVKESVAEKFLAHGRVFLAGDACHIHSVNGGQGLNTGIGDAFNLMWKLKEVIKFGAPERLLQSYEEERKVVAKEVVNTSGELVRSTKYSANGTHAQDYVAIVQRRAGMITGMGIRYPGKELSGSRLFDFEVFKKGNKTRLYSLLNYQLFTLLFFGGDAFHKEYIHLQDCLKHFKQRIQMIRIDSFPSPEHYWTESQHYSGKVLFVRPDSYIHSSIPLNETESLFQWSELINHFYKVLEDE